MYVTFTRLQKTSEFPNYDFLSSGTPISELAKVYPKVNITKDPKGKMKSISIELKHVILNSML